MGKSDVSSPLVETVNGIPERGNGVEVGGGDHRRFRGRGRWGRGGFGNGWGRHWVQREGLNNVRCWLGKKSEPNNDKAVRGQKPGWWEKRKIPGTEWRAVGGRPESINVLDKRSVRHCRLRYVPVVLRFSIYGNSRSSAAIGNLSEPIRWSKRES